MPGSKSITNRALLLAALAKGESALSGVLFSDDSRHFLDCVQKLGIETKVEEDNCNVTVNGHGGQVPAKDAAIYVGSAGTAARFHATPLERWVFDEPAYGASGWFCPSWVKVPEEAIGITRAGLASLLDASGLALSAHYPGNWKEVPGPFFQDVLVLEKPC